MGRAMLCLEARGEDPSCLFQLQVGPGVPWHVVTSLQSLPHCPTTFSSKRHSAVDFRPTWPIQKDLVSRCLITPAKTPFLLNYIHIIYICRDCSRQVTTGYGQKCAQERHGSVGARSGGLSSSRGAVHQETLWSRCPRRGGGRVGVAQVRGELLEAERGPGTGTAWMKMFLLILALQVPLGGNTARPVA